MSSWILPPRRSSYRAAILVGCALSSAALASTPCRAQAAEKTAKKAAKSAPSKATRAGDRDSARRLVLEGDSFYERRDYAQALDRYAQAYQLMRVPTVGIEVIKAQTALGKLVEAQATAQEVSSAPKKRGEPSVFEEARRRAAQSNLRLTGMIPSLWLEVGPSGVVFEVSIDGATPSSPPPYPLNPGAHQVQVQANGYRPLRLDITLREAERLNRRVDLIAESGSAASDVRAAKAAAGTTLAAKTASSEATPSPAQGEKDVALATKPAPVTESAKPAAQAVAEPEVREAAPSSTRSSSTRSLGWVSLGVAAVAAGAGTYAGIQAFRTKPDCPSDTCTPSQQDDIDSSTRMGTIANVSVGVAVVAGALGIWALVSSGEEASEESALLDDLPVTVGLGKLKEIRVSGRF